MREQPLIAVIILDNYDQRFAPLAESTSCYGFTNVCNTPVINYTMAWLSRCPVDSLFLVSSGDSAKYAEIVISEWESTFTDLKSIICEGATNVGDFLRELYSRELLTSDFLLITNPATVTSSTLEAQIAEYKKRNQESVDNVMSLIYSSCDSRDGKVIGLNSSTKKLLLYPSSNSLSHLKVDKHDFYKEVEIRRDIMDSGISICSRMIATQFSDNFDFQTLDDVIREILSKDDILGLNIHVEILPENESSFTATDYESLIKLDTLLKEKWFDQISPENVDSSKIISVCPRNVYIEESDINAISLSSRNSINDNSVNCFIGKDVKISNTARLINATIGNEGEIGENTIIMNCVIGKNVKIGANCKIEKAYILDDVVISSNTIIEEETIIAKNVIISEKEEIPSKCVVSTKEVDVDEYDKITSKKVEGLHIWNMNNGLNFWNSSNKQKGVVVDHSDDDSESDMDDDIDEDMAEGVVDSTKHFYDEVYDSMVRTLEQTDQQMSNVILDINSSKLAANVTMDEVARNVFAAFLNLPCNNDLKSMLMLILKWKDLFVHYYKATEDSLRQRTPAQRVQYLEMKKKYQVQLLLSIEDKYEKDADTFGSKVAKLVHYLYNDVDILEEDAILEWTDTIEEDSKLKTIMQPIVDWLQEDEDEEEEEED